MAFSEEEEDDEVASSSSNVEGLEDDTPDKAMLLGTGRELPTQADNFDIASTSRDESEEGGGKLPSDDDCSSDTEVVPDNECNSSTRVHSSSSIQKEPSQKLEDSISNAKGWWAVSSEEKEEKGQYAGWMAAKKGAYQEISEPLKIGCKQGSNDAMVTPEALPCESSLKEFSNLSISGHGSQRQSISLGKPLGIISNTFNRIADDVVATCIEDEGRDQHLNHIRLGIDLNLNDEGCQSVRNLYSISNAELEASQSSPTESNEGIEEMNVDTVASKHHQEEDGSMHFSLSGGGKGTPPLSLKESVLDTSSVGSQDPGEESQDDALNVVEKILWLNASAMSQNVGLQMARADQRSVQAGKGVRAVARTMETQMRKVQLSVYDWVGSEEDEDAYSMDKEGEEAAVSCEKKQETSNGMQTRHSKLPLDSKKEYENGTCMAASSDPSPNSKTARPETARPEVAIGRGTRKRLNPHINRLQHDIEERAQNIEDILSSSDEMINGSEEQPRSLGTNVNRPEESVIEQSLRGVVGQKSVTGNLQKMTLRHDLSSDRNLTSPERISEVKIHWGIVYNRRKRTPRINRHSITLINNADNFSMAESIACNSKMGRQVKTGGSAAQYPLTRRQVAFMKVHGNHPSGISTKLNSEKNPFEKREALISESALEKSGKKVAFISPTEQDHGKQGMPRTEYMTRKRSLRNAPRTKYMTRKRSLRNVSRTKYITWKRSVRNLSRMNRNVKSFLNKDESSDKDVESEIDSTEKSFESMRVFPKGPRRKRKLTEIVENVVVKQNPPLVADVAYETYTRRTTRVTKKSSHMGNDAKKTASAEKVDIREEGRLDMLKGGGVQWNKDLDEKIVRMPVIPKGLRKKRKISQKLGNRVMNWNLPFVREELSKSMNLNESRRMTRDSKIVDSNKIGNEEEKKELVVSIEERGKKALESVTCTDEVATHSAMEEELCEIVATNLVIRPTATTTNAATWEERHRRKRETGSVRVLFGHSLSGHVLKHQQEILVKLGGHVAASAANCTHFVADVFTRSRYMLETIAAGKPIVTTLWLESCAQACYFVDEKPYMLRDKKKEKELGFSMPSSLVTAQRRPLLMGFKVGISPNTSPDPNTMASIIEAAGGQVMPEFDSSVDVNGDDTGLHFIISCDKDEKLCLPFLEKGTKVYSTELILAGIPSQKLDFSRYEIFTEAVHRRRFSKRMAKYSLAKIYANC